MPLPAPPAPQPAALSSPPSPSLHPLASLFLSGRRWPRREDLRPFSPGVRLEPGLEAGLGQEFFALPAVLGRHLGQEHAAAPAVGHDQAVPADLDQAGIVDLFQGREDGDLEGEALQLGRGDGREPRIFRGGVNAGPDHGSASGKSGSVYPMQPRRSPPSVRVTNAPRGARRFAFGVAESRTLDSRT